MATKVSSLCKVVGDGELLFAPQASGELSDILLALLDGSIAHEPLIESGHRRAKLFTWEKTVAETVQVYRSLAAH